MAEIKKKRDYNNDYPSVTQALGVLRKIGLEMWYKFRTAKECDEISARGREIGTQIHELIQSYIDGQSPQIETTYEKEVTNAAKSFMLFRKEHPEFVLKKAEMALTDEENGYNGTLDCIAEIDGTSVVLDWKTGECKDKSQPPIYDEYLAQVSAYVNLYDKGIKDAYIVVFAKDTVCYSLKHLNSKLISFCFKQIFLPALKIYKAQKELKNILKNGEIK
ncbi:MAG: PD-(D/E)XK nuclease family protein [Endomicrobium sp.]|jgi:hypothetical protein|nr:PD-(D/E)XK nuclease family protein [Endomicrobium sp.]